MLDTVQCHLTTRDAALLAEIVLQYIERKDADAHALWLLGQMLDDLHTAHDAGVWVLLTRHPPRGDETDGKGDLMRQHDFANALQTLEHLFGATLSAADRQQATAALAALYHSAYQDGAVQRQPECVVLNVTELRQALLKWVRAPEGLGLPQVTALRLECMASGAYVRPEKVRIDTLTLYLTYSP